MSFAEYTSIKDKMSENPTLCNLFSLIATETWKRMEFAYTKMNDDISEPTITQNILFTINVFKEDYGLDIDFESSISERTNGHDIELVIGREDSDEIFYSPMQAKRLFSGGRYESYPHNDQIIKLIDYAYDPLRGAYPIGIPLYLLYNYSRLSDREKEELTSEWFCDTEIDETQWGCSVISAEYLRDNYLTSAVRDGRATYTGRLRFDDIHPNQALPWMTLVCCDSDKPKKLSTKLHLKAKSRSTKSRIIKTILSDVPNYPGVNLKKDFINTQLWQKLELKEDIDQKTDQKSSSQKKSALFSISKWEGDPEHYSPRFRVTITIPKFDIDTVLVHANPESYNKAVKQTYRSEEINVGKARRRTTKFIAFYVTKPTKQIVSYALVTSFVENTKNGKQTIYFKDLVILKRPINYDGITYKSVGRVYISRKKLLNAKTWTQVFLKKRRKSS